MDAAHHAFEILPSDCTTHIIKRQGGHLRGAVYLPKEQLAYVADIQLCTQKNDELERRLLLRFYHIQDDPDALTELGQILHRKQQSASNENNTNDNATPYSSMPGTENNDVMAKERLVANRHLKQTCSLIQRLMAAEKQKGGVEKMDHKQQSRYVFFLIFDEQNPMFCRGTFEFNCPCISIGFVLHLFVFCFFQHASIGIPKQCDYRSGHLTTNFSLFFFVTLTAGWD